MRYAPLLLPLAACTSSAAYREQADDQVYPILAAAAEHVTGTAKTYPIDRAEDTLRRRLTDEPEKVVLDLRAALDAAAENSRAFRQQKENLYRAGLALTREQHEFAVRFVGGTTDDVSGVDDKSGALSIRNDLTASKNTVSGGRIVAGFVNTFLKDIVSGGSFNGSTIFDLTLTQPLLRGAGRRIAREPLTQAERDVIYAMRSFERFRATFSVSVVTEYYRLLEQIANLESERANVESTRRNRERVEANVDAARLPPIDLDRAQQQEFSAEDRLNSAIANLEGQYDRFKLTLGLPPEAEIELDLSELDRLKSLAIVPVALDEETATALALARRLDYRTFVDTIDDRARQILVAEDALHSFLDFSAAVSVPSEPGQPLKVDWSNVGWSAGFDLDLALDRLVERNSFRAALIAMDATIRAREQAEDDITSEVRAALRAIRRTYVSHGIQEASLEQSERRLERADDFLQAGRGDTLALLDAQEDLLANRLSLTAAIVDYAVARLQLLRDLEGLALEPHGLRYDPALPLPEGPLLPYGATSEADVDRDQR